MKTNEREPGYYWVGYKGNRYIASYNRQRMQQWAVLFSNGEVWYVAHTDLIDIRGPIKESSIIDDALRSAEKTAKALNAGIAKRVQEKIEREEK